MVVIPTFNEEQAIGLVIDELFEVGYRNVVMLRNRNVYNFVLHIVNLVQMCYVVNLYNSYTARA